MLRRTLMLTLAMLVTLGAMIVPQGSAQAFCAGVTIRKGNGVHYCMVRYMENGRLVTVITDDDDD